MTQNEQLDALRNRRTFEVIPQFSSITNRVGESNLKQILGPNQMGFTLSDGNVQPELIYRLPGEWGNETSILSSPNILDREFVSFIPQYGDAVLSGLKYRIFSGGGYTWDIPRIYSQDMTRPANTQELKNTLDFKGTNYNNLSGFATNRQVLAYFYQFVKSMSNSGGQPQKNQFIYVDVDSNGTQNNYDLCTNFYNQLSLMVANISTGTYVSNTVFTDYANTVNGRFNNVYLDMIKTEGSVVDGEFTIFKNSKTIKSIPNAQLNYNNLTLSTTNINLSGYLQTDIVKSDSTLNLTTGDENIILGFSNAPINSPLLTFTSVNATPELTINYDDVDIIKKSDIYLSLFNNIDAIDPSNFIFNKRIEFTTNVTNGVSFGDIQDQALLTKKEIVDQLNLQKLNLTGTDNYFLYKDDVTSQTSLAMKRTSRVEGLDEWDDINFPNIKTQVGYETPFTPRDLGDIDEGSFLAKSEIDLLIESKVLLSPTPMATITPPPATENFTIRATPTGIEVVDYLLYDMQTWADPDATASSDASFDRRMFFNNNTLPFSYGIIFDSLNPTVKPLTNLSEIVDLTGVDFEYYIPNLKETLQEIIANRNEVLQISADADVIRPIKVSTVIEGSFFPADQWDTGGILSKGNYDVNNSAIIDSQTIDGQQYVRYLPIIKYLATPINYTMDRKINSTLFNDRVGSEIADSTSEWARNAADYVNPNINVAANDENKKDLQVHPHQIDIASYIGTFPGITEQSGYNGPSTIGIVISPLTYTYSDDYIQFFMKDFLGTQQAPLAPDEINIILESQIRNIQMYTNRDIMPKLAVSDLVDAKIMALPTLWENTMINEKYFVGSLPIVPTPSPGWTLIQEPDAIWYGWNQGMVGLSTGVSTDPLDPSGENWDIYDINNWFNGFYDKVDFKGEKYIYVTDRDPFGNLYNFLLTNGIAVGDQFELDILRLDSGFTANPNFATIDQFNVDGTLVYEVVGSVTSALIVPYDNGYGVLSETDVDNTTITITRDSSVHVYRFKVKLNEEKSVFPVPVPNTIPGYMPEHNKYYFTKNGERYMGTKLQIQSKQLWSGSISTPDFGGSLQDVTDVGNTTDNGIIITSGLNFGLDVSKGIIVRDSGVNIIASANINDPTKPNTVMIKSLNSTSDGILYNSFGGAKSLMIKYSDTDSLLSTNISMSKNDISLNLLNAGGVSLNYLTITENELISFSKVKTTVDQTDIGYTIEAKEFITKEYFDSVGSVINIGTTAERPTLADEGLQYFDTTLGYPIWRFSGNWVNATGAIV